MQILAKGQVQVVQTLKLSLEPSFLADTDLLTASISLRHLRWLLGPGVYAIFGRVGALYVGSAKNIIGRISEESHESFRKAVAEGTSLDLVFAKSEAHARDLEAQYIRILSPKYNVRGARGFYAEMEFKNDFAREFSERLDQLVQ